MRYVIWRNGEFLLLKNGADLQRAFAPIESEVEALSYAIAATGLGARYGLEKESGLRYFTDELEDTSVQRSNESYRVRLFDYHLCGCGPHTHYSVDIQVRLDGGVEELSRQPLYEDPEEDGLCID